MKRLISLLIVTTLFTTSVFANTSTTKEVTSISKENTATYTYEEALKRAKNVSNDIKDLKRTVNDLNDRHERYEENRTYVYGQVTSNPTMGGYVYYYEQASKSVLSTKYALEDTKSYLELTEVLIEKIFIDTLDALTLLDTNISILEKQVELGATTLSHFKLKKDLGMVSEKDYETEKLNFESLKNTLNQLKLQHENLSKSINIMLDEPYETEVFVLYSPKEMTPFEVDDIDRYITKAVLKNKKIKQLENEINLNDDIYKRTTYNWQDYYNSREQKKQLQDSIENANRAYKREKEDFYNDMKSAYLVLEQKEQSYKTSVSDLENAKNDFEKAKLNYEVGYITEHILNLQSLSVENAKSKVLSALVEYNKQKYLFENPDLINMN